MSIEADSVPGQQERTNYHSKDKDGFCIPKPKKAPQKDKINQFYMHLGVLEQYNVDLKEFAFKEKLGNGTQGEVQKVVHIQS